MVVVDRVWRERGGKCVGWWQWWGLGRTVTEGWLLLRRKIISLIFSKYNLHHHLPNTTRKFVFVDKNILFPKFVFCRLNVFAEK